MNKKLLLLLLLISSIGVYSQEEVLRIKLDSIKVDINTEESTISFLEYEEGTLIRSREIIVFMKKNGDSIFVETEKMQYFLDTTKYLSISKANDKFLVERYIEENNILYSFK